MKKIMVVAVAMGCAADPSAPGNEALGIEEFQVSITPDLTSIIGVDAQQQQVAKIELVHGAFTPTEDELGGVGRNLVDGRKLNIEIAGQTFEWQTVGYTDTTQMPALPERFDAVRALVADEHVRPLLAEWKIGWLPATRPSGTSESAYDLNCDYNQGPWGTNCYGGGNTGQSCQLTQFGGSTLACNGNPMWESTVVWYPTYYPNNTWSGGQSTVSMCCATVDNNVGYPQGGNWAVKTCNNEGGSVSACGDTGDPNVKCKPCFTPIPFGGDCSAWLYSPDGGSQIGCHQY